MRSTLSNTKNSWHPLVKGLAILSVAALVTIPAIAEHHDDNDRIFFLPGNLVVSRSVYDNNANNIAVGTLLAPNCTNTAAASGTPCVAATFNGTYPFVFNNVIPDPSFGITSKIFLDQITPFGFLLNSLEVPNSSLRN